MLELLPWLLASLSAILLIAATLLWWLGRRRRQPAALPDDWALAPRPVFNTDERRVYRQLREALPHHIVLSKLPLVRFCQPLDPQRTRYWYQLLGAINVTFAICSANGRVLAAIDLDNDRHGSRRTMQIKQSVLGACRIRYLRCPVDHLPSIPELQLLVPQSGSQTRGPQAAPAPMYAPDRGHADLSGRRRGRETLWQDSGFFHDSFFGVESRGAELAGSDFGALRGFPPRDDEGGAEGPPSRPSRPSGLPPVRH
ncbi:MAG TPA: DUF2726 domain-containing protein [Rubrivivax sp.]|nr:DUF2726 domain-containing protein [Burkholderiales bacterium]HNT39509.1 DUF2726 domain-containing protein [Rubrivivax sp.]